VPNTKFMNALAQRQTLTLIFPTFFLVFVEDGIIAFTEVDTYFIQQKFITMKLCDGFSFRYVSEKIYILNFHFMLPSVDCWQEITPPNLFSMLPTQTMNFPSRYVFRIPRIHLTFSLASP